MKTILIKYFQNTFKKYFGLFKILYKILFKNCKILFKKGEREKFILAISSTPKHQYNQLNAKVPRTGRIPSKLGTHTHIQLFSKKFQHSNTAEQKEKKYCMYVREYRHTVVISEINII